MTSQLILSLCIAAALVLAGCSQAPDTEPPASPQPAAKQPVPDRPLDDAFVAPSTEAPDVQAPKFPADGAIGFHGFGPAAFGADQEAVRMAWGRELGDAVPSEPGGCHYLRPQPVPDDGGRIAFMIDGDRFVRVEVTAPDIEAPGGGRVGMSVADIHARYGDAVEERQHKYVDDGRYLRIADPGGGDGVLLFETGADGRVGEWRIGLPPQVDWVEGCS